MLMLAALCVLGKMRKQLELRGGGELDMLRVLL